jgi:hypothetical protein
MITFSYKNDDYVHEDMTSTAVDMVYTVNNTDMTLPNLLYHFENFIKCAGYNLNNKMIDTVEK